MAKCLIWIFSKSQALTRVLWQKVDWFLCHICNKMFSSSEFAILTGCFIYISAKCLIWSFLKSQALPMVYNLLSEKPVANSFLYIVQSNWLILGDICNKMLSSSQFAILERFLIYLLAKCLIWSFFKVSSLE